MPVDPLTDEQREIRDLVREQYHASYYGAFILDLDGNNIEAVCHKPQ